ncbi:MAG: hypothetical protein KGM91_14540 [Burkholderiales bacterium]|nr:hypothetical protein [Burkholderiales bacterium]
MNSPASLVRLQRFAAVAPAPRGAALEFEFELASAASGDAAAALVSIVSVTGTAPERVRRLRIRSAHELVFDIADVLDARRNVLSAGMLVESMAQMAGLSGLAVDLRHLDLTPQALRVAISIDPADASALANLQVTAALC